MAVIEITDELQIEQALKNSTNKPVLIFKYSPICPVSYYAQNQFNQFLQENPEVFEKLWVSQIDVVGARPLSRKMAEILLVTHQSPQALLIQADKIKWHDSHNGVNNEALKKAVAALVL